MLQVLPRTRKSINRLSQRDLQVQIRPSAADIDFSSAIASFSPTTTPMADIPEIPVYDRRAGKINRFSRSISLEPALLALSKTGSPQSTPTGQNLPGQFYRRLEKQTQLPAAAPLGLPAIRNFTYNDADQSSREVWPVTPTETESRLERWSVRASPSQSAASPSQTYHSEPRPISTFDTKMPPTATFSSLDPAFKPTPQPARTSLISEPESVMSGSAMFGSPRGHHKAGSVASFETSSSRYSDVDDIPSYYKNSDLLQPDNFGKADSLFGDSDESVAPPVPLKQGRRAASSFHPGPPSAFNYCLDLGAEYDKSRFMIPKDQSLERPADDRLHKPHVAGKSTPPSTPKETHTEQTGKRLSSGPVKLRISRLFKLPR